ncbi:MAG: hypothetical protein CMH57_01390 [Myxococcales bacterium]|nr:hypothetical protein [Myxococcales bacterium]
MKKLFGALIAVSVVLGAGSAAMAQDDGALPRAGTATGGAENSGVVYKDETVYDFEDDLVEGSLVKPDGALIGGELHGKMSSLIKVRQDFIPEMIKSVEDL